jgi:shikimate kinase
MNLFLIGYRGSGKTSVAQALSERLGWPWLDADVELERRAGKSIKHIFADDGEPAFRDLESVIVADLATRTDHIIALGGGAVMRAENRAALQGRGKVIWLTAPPEVLAARIAADPTTQARRPSLTGLSQVDEIRELLAQRQKHYAACADLTIDSAIQSPSAIAAEIVAALQLQESA